MTVSYLKRRKDQFLKDFDKYSKLNIKDEEVREISQRIITSGLNAFISIIEKENK